MYHEKSILFAALALASASAMAGEAGQINISGLVSDNTCDTRVNGGGKDGLVLLDTALVDEVKTAGMVSNTTAGAKPKAFSLTIDCNKSGNALDKASVTFSSVFFSNSTGTLKNNESINDPAKGVNIALHLTEGPNGAIQNQVKVNDPSQVMEASFTNKVAVFDFLASYVRENSTTEVKSGHVMTNAAYTFTYQ